jgi:hypothetical protein
MPLSGSTSRIALVGRAAAVGHRRTGAVPPAAPSAPVRASRGGGCARARAPPVHPPCASRRRAVRRQQGSCGRSPPGRSRHVNHRDRSPASVPPVRGTPRARSACRLRGSHRRWAPAPASPPPALRVIVAVRDHPAPVRCHQHRRFEDLRASSRSPPTRPRRARHRRRRSAAAPPPRARALRPPVDRGRPGAAQSGPSAPAPAGHVGDRREDVRRDLDLTGAAGRSAVHGRGGAPCPGSPPGRCRALRVPSSGGEQPELVRGSRAAPRALTDLRSSRSARSRRTPARSTPTRSRARRLRSARPVPGRRRTCRCGPWCVRSHPPCTPSPAHGACGGRGSGPLLPDRVEEEVHLDARQREERVDALDLERLGERLSAGHLHRRAADATGRERVAKRAAFLVHCRPCGSL